MFKRCRAGAAVGAIAALVVASVAIPDSNAASVRTPVSIRINAGGEAFVDSAGRQWQADQYFEGGSVYSVSHVISGTANPLLYQSERWGMRAYRVPVPNGLYVVRLNLAEISPASGQRRMTVTAEGRPFVSNLDINAEVGDYAAYVRDTRVRVGDGVLDLLFWSAVNSPKVSGIQILSVTRGTGPTTTTTEPTSTTMRPPTTIAPVPTTTRPTIPATTSPTVRPTTTTAVVPRSSVPAPGAWTLAFSDEFNGSAIDTNKWNLNEGKRQNNVINHASNVTVSGGNAILTLASSSSGGMLTSATADNVGTNHYQFPIGGYAEARINFPGNGTAIYNWPAWWTVGNGWPQNGENDVAEGLGRLTVNYHSTSLNQNYGAIPGVWSNAFHTYGIHRKAGSVDIYYDGALVKSYRTAEPGVGHALVLNVGNGNTPAYGTASQMKVDWVRAYRPA